MNKKLLFGLGAFFMLSPLHAAPGELGFRDNWTYVNEADGQAVVTVIRSNGTDGTVTVKYEAVEDESALLTEDFIPVSGTLTFGPGQTVKTFSVPLVNDQVPEWGENIIVFLSNPTGGATIPLTSGFIAIADDDATDPGTFHFTTQNITRNEKTGKVDLTVLRTDAPVGAVTVQYETIDGSAIAGTDYVRSAGTITFGIRETSKIISIPFTYDIRSETDKTFTVILKSPSDGRLLVNPSQVFVTIEDDAAGAQIQQPKLKNLFDWTKNRQLAIPYTVDQGDNSAHHILMEIYTLAGEKVITLKDETATGSGEEIWDAKNSNNSDVAADVYLLTTEIDGKPQPTRKIILLK